MGLVDPSKQAERAAIAAQVEEFIRRGGQITQVPAAQYQNTRLTGENRKQLGLVPSPPRQRRKASA